MASYSIAGMRAIGSFYERKLRAAGVRSTEKLLERASTPKDRKRLAEQTGISTEQILRFTNLADLMRVRGVAADYAELLAAAGVDTVRELKRRNAANLVAGMAAVNAKKPIVEAVPGEKRVAGWIAEAKTLKPIIGY